MVVELIALMDYRFISQCSDYGLVSKELAAVAASAEAGADPLDPAVKRAGKITRFKREREVKAALQSLQEKRFGRLRLAQVHGRTTRMFVKLWSDLRCVYIYLYTCKRS